MEFNKKVKADVRFETPAYIVGVDALPKSQ
jgi:hypothetical protein